MQCGMVSRISSFYPLDAINTAHTTARSQLWQPKNVSKYLSNVSRQGVDRKRERVAKLSHLRTTALGYSSQSLPNASSSLHQRRAATLPHTIISVFFRHSSLFLLAPEKFSFNLIISVTRLNYVCLNLGEKNLVCVSICFQ